jgi:hypothetical protein
VLDCCDARWLRDVGYGLVVQLKSTVPRGYSLVCHL